MTRSSRLAARLAPLGIAATVLALLGAAPAVATRVHGFSASYRGTGSGHVSGKTAAGRATMFGRGRPIGRGTLTGSATGTFTSPTCVTFSGRATLRGGRGTLKLRARNGQACATGSSGDRVAFSGRARVVGGTSAFAGVRGVLSYSGTYNRSTGAVTISLRGRLTY